MSLATTIEHVSVWCKETGVDAFFVFYSDGRSRSSIWNGSTWVDAIDLTHERAINLAADYVGRGYVCESLMTGEKV